MKSLHPGAKWIFRISSYFFIFMISFFLSFFGITLLVALEVQIMLIIIYLVLAILIGEIYARLAYKFWKYDFTNTELKIEKGIIWKTYKSIPYQRVQNIEIYRGLIARIFGFSSLAIHTAGYSAVMYRGIWGMAGGGSEGNLPAVSIEDAEKTRQFLMSKIGRKSGL